MVDIFDPMTDSVANTYTMFTSLPADSSDGLSKYICSGCHKNIVDFQKFRALCIQSYNILIGRKLVSQDVICVDNDSEYEDVKCESPDLNSEPDGVSEPDFTEEDRPPRNFQQPVRGVKTPAGVVGKKKPRSKIDNTKMYCDICQKGFRRKFLLEGHMREHKGLKPFQCEICENKQFISITNYNEHMNSKHTANRVKRIFKCDYEGCDKTYHISVNIQIVFLQAKAIHLVHFPIELFRFITVFSGKPSLPHKDKAFGSASKAQDQ